MLQDTFRCAAASWPGGTVLHALPGKPDWEVAVAGVLGRTVPHAPHICFQDTLSHLTWCKIRSNSIANNLEFFSDGGGEHIQEARFFFFSFKEKTGAGT